MHIVIMPAINGARENLKLKRSRSGWFPRVILGMYEAGPEGHLYGHLTKIRHTIRLAKPA